MIELKNVSKHYGKLNVLNEINFVIEEGTIVAVLGPNGSGKTTIIKSVLGLVIPDSGEIIVGGNNIRHDVNYRNTIGYLPQIARFPENLRVLELIHMIKDLRNASLTREKELIHFFGISSFVDKPLRSLSGGTRQKVNLVLSLMFDSPIYIFDEPTVGLDPVSRVHFKEFIKKEKGTGKTVLLTTHILSEVEELADEIIFLLEGKIHYRGSPASLKHKEGKDTLEKAIASLLENDSRTKLHHA